MTQSELKYLIGAQFLRLKYRVFAGKTCPIPTVRVFCVVYPVAKDRVRVELFPEPTLEFGTVATTTCDTRAITILLSESDI